jgi:hypothetical protein
MRRCEDCHGQHDTGAEALWCSFLVGVTGKTLRTRQRRRVWKRVTYNGGWLRTARD